VKECESHLLLSLVSGQDLHLICILIALVESQFFIRFVSRFTGEMRKRTFTMRGVRKTHPIVVNLTQFLEQFLILSLMDF
jgi:hypothetical protein